MKAVRKTAPIPINFAAIMRRRGLALLDRLFANNDAIYFGPPNPRNSEKWTDEDWELNGMIRTSNCHYRPFRIRLPGHGHVRVLLASYDPGCLKPVKNNQGQWRLKPDHRAYMVDAVEVDTIDGRGKSFVGKAAGGGYMSRAMMEHFTELRDASANHLNLMMANLTDLVPQDDPANPKEVYKLTNGELAYGIFERSDGKWDVRLYVENEKLETSDIDRFIKIDDKPPRGFLGRAFSLGQGQGTFDTYEQAFMFAFRDWAELRPPADDTPEEQKNAIVSRAYRIWAGKSPLRMIDKIRDPISHIFRTTLSASHGFKKKKVYRAVLTAALVSGAPAVFSSVKLTRLIGASVSTIAAVGRSLTDMAAEESMLKSWSRVDIWIQKQKARLGFSIRHSRLAHRYIAQTPGNEDRWCPKIAPEFLPYFEPISQEAAGIKFDDQPCTPYSKFTDPEHWLSTLQNRLYASVYMPLNDDMMTSIMPNGVVAFYHISPETGTKTSYMAVRPDLDVDSQVQFPTRLKEEFNERGIIKVVNRPGTPAVSVKTVSFEEFADETERLVDYEIRGDEGQASDTKLHIYELFSRATGIRKKTMEPIAEIVRRKTGQELAGSRFHVPCWCTGIEAEEEEFWPEDWDIGDGTLGKEWEVVLTAPNMNIHAYDPFAQFDKI